MFSKFSSLWQIHMSQDGPALSPSSSNNKKCPLPFSSLFALLLADQDELFYELKTHKCLSCYHLTYAVQLETWRIHHWNPSYRVVDWDPENTFSYTTAETSYSESQFPVLSTQRLGEVPPHGKGTLPHEALAQLWGIVPSGGCKRPRATT